MFKNCILGQVNPNNAPPPKSELPIFHHLTTTTSYPSTYVHPHFCLAASSPLALPLFCNLSALLWPGSPPNSRVRNLDSQLIPCPSLFLPQWTGLNTALTLQNASIFPLSTCSWVFWRQPHNQAYWLISALLVLSLLFPFPETVVSHHLPFSPQTFYSPLHCPSLPTHPSFFCYWNPTYSCFLFSILQGPPPLLHQQELK